MILPMWMIKSLHITTAQKLGLAFVAGLVLIDIGFDILRTVFTIDENASSK